MRLPLSQRRWKRNAPASSLWEGLLAGKGRKPAPWHYAEYIYRPRHCEIHRDGRVIASHFPIGNGATMAAAPAMASLLRELAAGVPANALRERAESILREIDRCAPRQPGARVTSNRIAVRRALDAMRLRRDATVTV